MLTAGVGVGKTVMTVAAIENLAEEFGETFAGVIVCAGSIKHQWRDEIAKFTGGTQDERGRWSGGSSCIVIDGTPDKRMRLYEQALDEKPRYVILGYNQVIDDNNMVQMLNQSYCVVDEITHVKSPNAVITQAVRSTFGEAPFRFGLTGTPMENGKADELFQLMVFIDDSVLGRADLFDKTFIVRDTWGKVQRYQNLDTFRDMMSDCSVSIDADDPDVSPYMPTMAAPSRVLVTADAETARLYNDVMSPDLQDELADAMRKSHSAFDVATFYGGGDDGDGDTKGRIMSRISCMRMLLSHPDQLVASGQSWLDAAEVHDADPAAWPQVKKRIAGRWKTVDKPLGGSAYAAQLLQDGELDGLDSTPKMDELLAAVRETLLGGCVCCSTYEDARTTNKVVLFSYHKMLLRVLARHLGPVAVRYDGSMTLKAKNAVKTQFQRDPSTRVFLTSDAGGYGIDLPQANHLFNADVPFTAGRVVQRNARIRRATREFHDVVHVRSYLIENSIDCFYADVTASKGLLPGALRTGKGMDKGVLQMSPASLNRFLAMNKI